jgi:hypothetical protein
MIGRLLLLASSVAFASTAFGTPNPAAAGKPCFHEDERIHMNGTLVKRRFFGPPNFGENPKTDERVSVYVFRPARPLLPCDIGDFDNANENDGAPVKELVVVPFGKQHRLGKQTLTGTISRSVTASQFLDYVFQPE